MTNPLPIVYATLTLGRECIHMAVPACPHCGKRHGHGWTPSDGYRPSHRVADCGGNNRGYFVLPAPGEVERLDMTLLGHVLERMGKIFDTGEADSVARWGTVDDARNVTPGRDHRCSCGHVVSWASLGRQLDRLLSAGMTRERAVASLPRCRTCITALIHKTREAAATTRAKRAASAHARAERQDAQRRQLEAWANANPSDPYTSAAMRW